MINLRTCGGILKYLYKYVDFFSAKNVNFGISAFSGRIIYLLTIYNYIIMETVVMECSKILTNLENFTEISTVDGFKLSNLGDIFLVKGKCTNDVSHYDNCTWDEKQIQSIQQDNVDHIEVLGCVSSSEKTVCSILNTKTKFMNLGQFVKIEKMHRVQDHVSSMIVSYIVNVDDAVLITPATRTLPYVQGGWSLMKFENTNDETHLTFLFKYDVNIPECFCNVIGLKGLQSVFNIARH